MKMCFLFSGIFWGLLLVLIGVAIVVKAVFHVNIPILRLFFAFLFIYIGVRLLLGSCSWRRPSGCCGPVVVTDRAESGSREYNTVFGKRTIDLTGVELKDKDERVECNAVMGALKINIKSSTPTVVEGNAVFGDIRLPDGDDFSFGSRTYRNEAYAPDKPHLRIQVNAVFGNVLISQE